jgi:hypothetical protein
MPSARSRTLWWKVVRDEWLEHVQFEVSRCMRQCLMATSLPMTWQQSMVNASHWVGFVLPGMIELPGSFSGIEISPRCHSADLMPATGYRWRSSSRQQKAFSACTVCRQPRFHGSPECRKLVLDRYKWNADRSSKACGNAISELGVCIDSSADRRPANGELEKRAGKEDSDQTLRRAQVGQRNRKTPVQASSGVASCKWVRPIFSSFGEVERLVCQRSVLTQPASEGSSFRVMPRTSPPHAWPWERHRSKIDQG